MIDVRLLPHNHEEITTGEAIAGMIVNGGGCANRPLSLPPQFFANTPLDLLCRLGVRADMLNRVTLGRSLDEVYGYGCDLLLSERALAVCAHEGSAQRCNPLDTTSCALTGESIPDSDDHAIAMTHGSSTDHRPDVQQAV